MEPLPETREAVSSLDSKHERLLGRLLAASDQVRHLVPDCVGISLALSRDDLTFTLVATDTEFAVLDAVQYLAGGPCVEAVRAERVLEENPDDLFGEPRWQLFAQASAAKAVRSTLTLPILSAEMVTGSINLYGASGNCFAGHHEALSAIFGAWAPGAVVNADLSFRTRLEAQQAPTRLAELRALDTAIGIISERLGIDLETARCNLNDAAQRGGVTEADLARAVLESLRSNDAQPGGAAEVED